MRKTLLLWSIIAVALFAVSCGDDGETNQPSNGTKPSVTLTEITKSASSFTFELKTTVAGEYGYCCIESGSEAPTASNLLAMNTGSVTDKVELSVSDLEAGTAYTLYAVVAANDLVSDIATLSFTTSEGSTTEPTISVKEVEVTESTFTFEITTDTPGEFGYVYAQEGYNPPAFHEWFAQNSGEVTDKETVTIEHLSDNTTYKLYIVLRSAADGTFSAPKTLTFTTKDDGIDNPIIVENTTFDSITFTINLPGRYIFMVVAQMELDYYGQPAEEYLKMFNIVANGPATYEWIDGGSYEAIYDMIVKSDRDYVIVAAQCDEGKNIIGDVYTATCRTPTKPQSSASVTTELSDITSTSVNISTTPDSSISEYYVYVRDKAWTEGILSGYGESMLITLLKSPSAGAWYYTTANEGVWAGLTPDTVYYCLVAAIDNMGGESITKYEFTTLSAAGGAPTVDATITEPAENAHTSLNINIFSEQAATVKYIFRPTADVEAQRNQYNYTDAEVVANNGITLSAEDVAAIQSSGFTIVRTDLWPDTEYTAIISVKSSEQVETVTTITHNTQKRPVPARVESSLFTSLLGEWEVSYTYIDYSYEEQRISGKVVTIAQGIDATTEKEYREQNQLVVLGWPFQQDDFVDGGGYISVDDLKYANSYWADYTSLAFRDYGPKIFLEIGAGDVVTVPTSLGTYLFNDEPNGGYVLNFFGCDYDNGFTAPATFPVTVSADGNTITIGAHHSGEEFGYGIYRPAVFRNNAELRCAATTDIVLKRVK